MILVDTSVWVAHFRKADPALAALLDSGFAGTHPFVIGELACGNLKDRLRTLADVALLAAAPVAIEKDVRHLLEAHNLSGKGVGWVDLHLLASVKLVGWSLWTLDAALAAAAAKLRVSLRFS